MGSEVKEFAAGVGSGVLVILAAVLILGVLKVVIGVAEARGDLDRPCKPDATCNHASLVCAPAAAGHYCTVRVGR